MNARIAPPMAVAHGPKDGSKSLKAFMIVLDIKASTINDRTPPMATPDFDILSKY